MTATQRLCITLYFTLLVLTILLLIGANFMNPLVRESILPISSDAFKTVLGALLGSISVLLGNKNS